MATHTVSHRWHLQTQRDENDWSTQIDSSVPITHDEVDRYRSMEMFKDHEIRIIHVVTTTTVDRTRVSPVDKPIPVND